MASKAKFLISGVLIIGVAVAIMVKLSRGTPIERASTNEVSPRLIGKWISRPDDSKPIAREITFRVDGTAHLLKDKGMVIYRFTCEPTEVYFERIQKETGKKWDQKTLDSFRHFFPSGMTMVSLWSGQKPAEKSEGSLGFEPISGLLYAPFSQEFYRSDGTSTYNSSKVKPTSPKTSP